MTLAPMRPEVSSLAGQGPALWWPKAISLLAQHWVLPARLAGRRGRGEGKMKCPRQVFAGLGWGPLLSSGAESTHKREKNTQNDKVDRGEKKKKSHPNLCTAEEKKPHVGGNLIIEYMCNCRLPESPWKPAPGVDGKALLTAWTILLGFRASGARCTERGGCAGCGESAKIFPAISSSDGHNSSWEVGRSAMVILFIW